MKILKNITHLVVMGIIATLFSSGALAIAPDYGDLVYLLRDADGVPVPDENSCRQPLAFPSDECPAIPVEFCPDPTDLATCLVPIDAECEIVAEFANCVREVEFGRISVSRSPEDIFTRQLCDVVATLDAVDEIQLDPAGRLVGVSTVLVDGEEVTDAKTIDSPVQNLAIYWQLMLNGEINTANLDTTNLEDCPDASITFPVSGGWGELITAARGLGAAADKGGKVDVDMIAYLNRILKLTDPDTAPDTLIENSTLCTLYNDGEECFLDYSGFEYMRESNFSWLPEPPYVVPEGEELRAYGYFEFLSLWRTADAVDNPFDYDLFYIRKDEILKVVFPLLNELDEAIGIDPGETGGNIAGFAQAADDARAVINFMHEHPVPVGYETEVIYEGDDGNGGSGTSTFSSSGGGGCSVAGGNPATDLSLLAILLAALGYLGLGMTRRT